MAKCAVSENSLAVLNYLKENDGAQMTAADIAEAMGMDVKKINGVVTSGLARKGLAERVPAQVEVTDEEGNTKYKDVKFIQLTDAGKSYDHESAVAADAEAAAKAE